MDDMLDDSSFYLLIHRKDDVTFAKFYDHFSKAIFGVVLKSVKDHCIAEDITQDTFVKAYNNFVQFDPAKGRLYTWLSTIARNSCIDFHRKKHYQFVPLEDVFISPQEDLAITNRLEIRLLQNELSKLNPSIKLIIQLVYFHGFTHEETASICCIPLGTVKTRIRSTILKLTNRLVSSHA